MDKKRETALAHANFYAKESIENLKNGNVEKAVRSADVAIGYDAECTLAYVTRAEALNRKAMADVQKAIELAKADPIIYNGWLEELKVNLLDNLATGITNLKTALTSS